MKGKKVFLTVLSVVLIVTMSMSIPVSAVGKSSNKTDPWKSYEALAKSYGCVFSVNEKDRAKFCKSMSLAEFEESLKIQKNQIDSMDSTVVAVCSAPATQESAMAFAATSASTTTTATWQGSGMIGATIGLNTFITATYYTSTRTFKSCDRVSSALYGFTLGYSWSQTDWSSSMSSTKKTLYVTVYGNLNFVFFVEGIGTLYSWARSFDYSAAL